MLYKTICLRLLEERPAMHERLRLSRTLLTTLNRLAGELRTSHEAWKARLSQANPTIEPSQISGEAMELALKELVDSLPSESPDDDPLTLDAAMAFIQPTPPA